MLTKTQPMRYVLQLVNIKRIIYNFNNTQIFVNFLFFLKKNLEKDVVEFSVVPAVDENVTTGVNH